MLKRTLIAIAVVAFLGTSAQAIGPEPHTPDTDGDVTNVLGGGQIKVNLENVQLGWPVEYKALALCIIPVKMHVGYFVEVEECHKRKIKLVQVECADIGKGSGDWPCYLDCENVKIRANFAAKLGLSKSASSDVLKDWSAYYKDGDTVDASGSWNTVTVCVKAWKARLYKNTPGTEIEVGTVTITIKPQA